LGAASGLNRPTVTDLNGYTFERYVSDFKHTWAAGSKEFLFRKEIFETELARVHAHNKRGLSWKEGISKFSAYTSAELKAYKGHSKGVARTHKPQFEVPLPSNFHLKPVSELPASMDWRNEGVITAVKDQGHCGSCWAFASAAVLESHVAIQSGLLYDLSPQQIAMCAPNPDHCGGTGGCQGATSELAFDYVAGAGILEEYQLGYQAYYGADSACGVNAEMTPVATIDGYVKLPENNYTALMNAIAQVGPIAVSVDASNWHSYSSGIFNGCNQVNPDINHAVVLVGYGEDDGEKYWLVRNSWSPAYGESGYIRVARFDTEDQLCGMDVTPLDGTACEGDDTPVKVCGTCGILYDSAYPTGATLA